MEPKLMNVNRIINEYIGSEGHFSGLFELG